ncbi:RHS repeat-associated core domain-containing protein, partial [Tenacibaculum maritimum]|uniref:RHS repeat domain-containing protein n=1 Tax=Tenacibaculum maritimum TaxID=107401 RepID=UPI00387605D9
QSDRVYGKGGRLLKDEEYHYKYDVEGHLILKSKRRINEKLAMPKHDNILDKWLGSGKPSKEAQLAHENWQLGDWGYVWYGNGRLKEVKNPDGSVVKMEYDALGRRTSKRAQGKVTRFFWDGNVLLHEWNHKEEDTPTVVVDAIGMLSYDKVAPIENLVTWVYESGRFVPSAKLVGGERYSILSDYLGTPIQAYDARGNIVWECELDIYGKVRNLHGEKTFIPFRYQGQYEDVETGLYYNRFRYYSPDTGTYISKDPIGLLGNNPNLYAYVHDVNSWVDVFGLDCSKLKTKDINFMQSSIKNKTGDFTVLGNAEALKNGVLKVSSLPTVKVWKDATGKIWSLDHRRLAAFKLADIKEIPVQWATKSEVASQMWKMTTKTGGESIRLKMGDGVSKILKF